MKRIPGVRYVVAPYEADAQLGFLARNGHVDAVITEDSDIMLFGCSRVIFKLERDGTGQEVDLSEVFSRRYMIGTRYFTRRDRHQRRESEKGLGRRRVNGEGGRRTDG